jgi:hypothetical protein
VPKSLRGGRSPLFCSCYDTGHPRAPIISAMVVTLWDVAIVLLWFVGASLGLRVWVRWLRPARSWYYSPSEAPGVAVRVATVIVTAGAIGIARIPVAVVVVGLGFMTLVVIIIGVPLTLIAYRDRLRRM